MLQSWSEKYKTPSDKVSASSIAGAVGGGAGGLLSRNSLCSRGFNF